MLRRLNACTESRFFSGLGFGRQMDRFKWSKLIFKGLQYRTTIISGCVIHDQQIKPAWIRLAQQGGQVFF